MVQASDLDGLQSESNAEVLISILDSTQHPPEFSMSFYRFEIPENANQNAVVGIVEATIDTGKLNELGMQQWKENLQKQGHT